MEEIPFPKHDQEMLGSSRGSSNVIGNSERNECAYVCDVCMCVINRNI